LLWWAAIELILPVPQLHRPQQQHSDPLTLTGTVQAPYCHSCRARRVQQVTMQVAAAGGHFVFHDRRRICSFICYQAVN
jgi:hypothetical protein